MFEVSTKMLKPYLFSVYPRKCQGNFRKHLVEEHRARVREIFRCD